MDTKKILQADYLDIVFDNRNKAYGGYELRRNYDRRVKKGVSFLMLGVAAIASFSFIDVHKKNGVVAPTIQVTTILRDVRDNPPIVKPATPPSAPPPAVKTNIYTPPKIVDASEVTPDETMTEVSKLKDSNPGLSNNDSGISGQVTSIAGTSQTPAVAVNTTPPETPPSFVDQMPEFRGNLAEYLAKNINYPPEARDANVQGRVGIQFVVNEDGSISNVRVIRSVGGGCDEEAVRVIKSMPKWKPGKNNGVAVKVMYTQNIVFRLEN